MAPLENPTPAEAVGNVPLSMATTPALRGASGLAGFCRNLSAGARLLCFLRVPSQDFAATPGQLVSLAALGLLVNLAAAFAFVGADGYFNYGALPSAAFGVLLVLLAGHAIAALAHRRELGMLLPVAVASASVILNALANLFWLALVRGWVDMGLSPDSMPVYYTLFGWWSLAMLAAVWRLAGLRSPLPALAFGVLVLLPSWHIPPGWLWEPSSPMPGEGELSIPSNARFDESDLYAQPGLLRDALARIPVQRPGVQDLYFVGFAPYGSQDVFMKEVDSVREVLAERFDLGARSILLVNNPALLDSKPIATLTSLRSALRTIGERIDPEEDVVLLHITTHGSESHELSVELPPLRLDQIHPRDLRAALDDAHIRWRIIVVSACYSGGFVEALKDARTLVATAADASNTSFGCSSDSDYTYFSRAFYEEGLRRTRSFAEAFAVARRSVSARERGEKLPPSNPQLFVGEAIARKLAGLERLHP